MPEEFPDGALRPDRRLRGPLLPRRARLRRHAATRSSARCDGTLLAVHWRPSAPRYPLTGDEVHERLSARFGPPAYTPPDRQVQPRPLRRMRLLIVGGGPAALATARAYREAGGDGDVTLLTPELTVPYTPPAALEGVPARRAGRRGAADRAAPSGTRRTPIDVRLGAEAETLDPAARTLVLGTGETLQLRRVRARHRRRADAAAGPGRDRGMGAAAAQPGHRPRAARPGRARPDSAIVIGSGFIGCEAAASLAHARPAGDARDRRGRSRTRRGSATTAGRRIQGWLEELGVDARCSAPASRRSASTPSTSRTRPADRRADPDGRRRQAVRGAGGDRRARRRGRPDRGRRAACARPRDGVFAGGRRRARPQRRRRPPAGGRALGRGAQHGRGRRPRRSPASRRSGTSPPASGRRSASTRSSTSRGATASTRRAWSTTAAARSRSGTGAKATTVGVLTHERDEDYETRPRAGRGRSAAAVKALRRSSPRATRRS